MRDASQLTFTALLARARRGDEPAVRELFPLVYDELRRIARAQRRSRAHETITTAIVNEAYIRLAGPNHVEIRDRSHFMSVAARPMRQVLVDRALAHLAAKRGGGAAGDFLPADRRSLGERARSRTPSAPGAGRVRTQERGRDRMQ